MPGTITFKPIEANLTHNTDFITKMNPYCSFIVGDNVFKSEICKNGGKHPHWNDSITVPMTSQSNIILELMDKDKISRDDHIGSLVLNLNDLQAQGATSRWYPLTYKNKPAGEILLETVVSGDYSSNLNQGFIEGTTTGLGLSQQGSFNEGYVTKEQDIITNQNFQQETYLNQGLAMENRKTFQEQSQVIEPHTFIKEVDVVETRPVSKTIEVMEPTRVLKDVQYTQAVSVKKTIEVCEPQVVTKEVEVIEPRLVTKQIQVIENVPVKRQVEVIESVPIMKEVETFEPQTFTKQVEVTDYIPTLKQVTVTEPVTVKKAVEFVEPIITTKTITKEIPQEVIINEEIRTTVGPATIIGWETHISTIAWYREGQARLAEQRLLFEERRLNMIEEERLREEQRLLEEERLFNERVQQEQLRFQQLQQNPQGFSSQSNLYSQSSFTNQPGFTSSQQTYSSKTEQYEQEISGKLKTSNPKHNVY